MKDHDPGILGYTVFMFFLSSLAERTRIAVRGPDRRCLVIPATQSCSVRETQGQVLVSLALPVACQLAC